MDQGLLDSARHFYLDEMSDLATYQLLAKQARDPFLREVLGRTAALERRHVAFWRAFLDSRGVAPPAPRPGRWRPWLLRWLPRIVSPVLLVSALELGESGAVRRYSEFLREAVLSDTERSALRRILVDELEHELTFKRESEKLGAAHVRDFVLGMNDGLVELLGAVTGLSAVYPGNPLLVGVSGLVVGIAGSLSMGIGAFISVRSQRQVNQGGRERLELLFEVAPERAVGDYLARLQEAGVPEEARAGIAQLLGTNRDAVARLLLEDSSENEWRSGLFTGLAYLFGVAFPVLPYFLASHSGVALAWSVLLAGLALAAVASVVSMLSGIAVRRKVAEMVFSGLGAAVLAYGFGKAMQALLGLDL